MANSDQASFLKIKEPFEDKEGHDSDLSSTHYDLADIESRLNDKLAEANEKFDQLINDTKKELKIIRKSVKTSESEMEDKIVNVSKEIDESKDRVVETLALFAALFTFLSLEVQVFKGEQDPNKLIGLILIAGGLVTFFILILDLMIKSKGESKDLMKTRFFLLLTMSIFLIIAGILAVKTIV